MNIETWFRRERDRALRRERERFATLVTTLKTMTPEQGANLLIARGEDSVTAAYALRCAYNLANEEICALLNGPDWKTRYWTGRE